MKYGLLLFAVVFALVFVAESRATIHDPRLDGIATLIAGHPVVAVCATTDHEWTAMEDAFGPNLSFDGYTQVTLGPNIYLAPWICGPLLQRLNGNHDIGPFYFSLDLKTLIHESIHQRGIFNESITDCTALTLIKQYAVSSFGYPAVVTQVSYIRQGSLYKRVTKIVPNPELTKLYQWAVVWHQQLPIQYQGAC